MYAFITGDVFSIAEDHIVLDHDGIGYKIFCSGLTAQTMNIGDNTRLYTEYIVRDDGVYLYGFADEDERTLFNDLTTVTSIGPKVAMGILSALTVRQIRYGVLNNDIDLLMRAPGVGKKTASRLILELVDKMKAWVLADEGQDDEPLPQVKGDDSLIATAVEALLNLGYQKKDVEAVVKRNAKEQDRLEDLIRKSLSDLAL